MPQEMHTHVRDIVVLTTDEDRLQNIYIFMDYVQSIERTKNKENTYVTFSNGESIVVNETPEEILSYLKVKIMKKEENKGVQ